MEHLRPSLGSRKRRLSIHFRPVDGSRHLAKHVKFSACAPFKLTVSNPITSESLHTRLAKCFRKDPDAADFGVFYNNVVSEAGSQDSGTSAVVNDTAPGDLACFCEEVNEYLASGTKGDMGQWADSDGKVADGTVYVSALQSRRLACAQPVQPSYFQSFTWLLFAGRAHLAQQRRAVQ